MRRSKPRDRSQKPTLASAKDRSCRQEQAGDGRTVRQGVAGNVREMESLRRLPYVIQCIYAHKEDNHGAKSYFVKFQNRSFRECKWISADEVRAPSLIADYEKRAVDVMVTKDLFNPNFIIPEKVVASRESAAGNAEYLIKWCDLDYNDLTWESATDLANEALIAAFVEVNTPPVGGGKALERPIPSGWCVIPMCDVQPAKDGRVIRPYQLHGINFLTNSWLNKRSAIIADEKGLGKTIQTIVFLEQLIRQGRTRGPFLVIGRLERIGYWEHEIACWANMSTLGFYGTSMRREMIREHEMFYPNSRIPKFNMLLTTYENVMNAVVLHEINWECIVVDGASRFNTDERKLVSALISLKCESKVILTEVPLQSNTVELWTLLKFLDERSFQNLREFQQKYGDLSASEQVTCLHNILRPMMIGRTKCSVEKQSAPLREIIVECSMTRYQRSCYQLIYHRNMDHLKRAEHSTSRVSANNMFMELKKVCNHPFLVNGAEKQILAEGKALSENESTDGEKEALVRSAGKMILLDKLLTTLRNANRRVLIFSQMAHMLDIIERYLRWKNYEFEKVDGSVRSTDRQKSIDRFNEEGNRSFVFLLCAKAGGVGLNLISADTVIMYDGEWNTQADLQAMIRFHQSNQSKEVELYRLLMAKSYERAMFERSSAKIGRDNVSADHRRKALKTDEVENILRLGAYYAFNDETFVDDHFSEETIESILSKATVIKHDYGDCGYGSTLSNVRLRVDEADKNVDLSSRDFWDKIVPGNDGDNIGTAERSVRRGGKSARRGKSQNAVSKAVNVDDEEPDFEAQVDEQFIWCRSSVHVIMNGLLKFGWGRWKMIRDNVDFKLSSVDMQSMGLAILRVLIDASSGDIQMFRKIYDGAKLETDKKEEVLVKKYKALLNATVKPGSNWKIGRIESLFFLNLAITTCPDLPHGLAIPRVSSQKPSDWWDDEDDRVLLYGVWKYGYLCYDKIDFETAEGHEQPNQTFLTARVSALLNAMKQSYLRYVEALGKDVPFTHAILVQSLGAWTSKEQARIVSCISLYGLPSIKKFYDKCGLNSKPFKAFEDFVEKLMRLVNALVSRKKMQRGEIPERITLKQARRLIDRVRLFKTIRSIKNTSMYSEADRYLITHVSRNGLLDLSDDAGLLERFGKEDIEDEAVKALDEIARKLGCVRPAPSQTVSAPRQQHDLPMKVGTTLIVNSMGTCVWDRPNFHNKRYIYPVGYESVRLYVSLVNPREKTWYRSRILDRGDHDPIFCVDVPDHPTYVFEGTAPSGPWLDVMKAIEAAKRRHGMPATRALTVSGPEYFGISAAPVLALMRTLPGVEKCTRFDNRTTNHGQVANQKQDPPEPATRPARRSNDVSPKRPRERELSRRQRDREMKSSEPDYAPVGRRRMGETPLPLPQPALSVSHSFPRILHTTGRLGQVEEPEPKPLTELVFSFAGLSEEQVNEAMLAGDNGRNNNDPSVFLVASEFLIDEFNHRHVGRIHDPNPLQYIVDVTKREMEAREHRKRL